MPVMPEIATAKEVATYLRVSPKTVSNYAAAGLFAPGIYIGRDRYNMHAMKNAIEHPPYRYLISVRENKFCFDKK